MKHPLPQLRQPGPDASMLASFAASAFGPPSQLRWQPELSLPAPGAGEHSIPRGCWCPSISGGHRSCDLHCWGAGVTGSPFQRRAAPDVNSGILIIFYYRAYLSFFSKESSV